MLQKVVFGPLKEPAQNGEGVSTVAPLGWPAIVSLTPLMVLIVWIGVAPRPFLDRYQTSLNPIAARVQSVPKVASGLEPSQTPTSPAIAIVPAGDRVVPARRGTGR